MDFGPCSKQDDDGGGRGGRPMSSFCRAPDGHGHGYGHVVAINSYF